MYTLENPPAFVNQFFHLYCFLQIVVSYVFLSHLSSNLLKWHLIYTGSDLNLGIRPFFAPAFNPYIPLQLYSFGLWVMAIVCSSFFRYALNQGYIHSLWYPAPWLPHILKPYPFFKDQLTSQSVYEGVSLISTLFPLISLTTLFTTQMREWVKSPQLSTSYKVGIQ